MPSGLRPLVVAANRLPISRTETGWTTSPGGLVRALLPIVRERSGMWVGWTGEVDHGDHGDHALHSTNPIEVDGLTLYPIPISEYEFTHYYEGFSNNTLWPLYHDAIRDSGFQADDWDAYVSVNTRFATTLATVAPPDALVWLHDYHLQLVPAQLRELRRDVRIGWFNHIPFPPVELFQRLPWRDQIIDGLLGADLLGFQRVRGAANFRAAAVEMGGVVPVDVGADSGALTSGAAGEREVMVRSFPISIDVGDFEQLASSRQAGRQLSQIRSRLGDPGVVLLGVDRLDYTKGIGARLRAFGQLLDDGRLDPLQHVLVQIATPTREGVGLYQEERREIEQLVGAINGRHARLGFPVIHYLAHHLPIEELVPLYRAGDVMLVTPLRDGMNLVAKEYVASHVDGDGVLVLSEFTGAADELTEALLINPHDEIALQDAIMTAVEMGRQERRQRMQQMRFQLAHHDVSDWASAFLAALDS